MLDFQPIFDTHFFSNHHVQAQAVEAQLAERFPGCECVTFSSFAGLLTSVVDELCESPGQFVVVSPRDDVRQRVASLNLFLSASGRGGVAHRPDLGIVTPPGQPADPWPADACLTRAGQVVAWLYDASGLHPMLAGAGLFVTADAAMSETIRWARSSYGRRGAAHVGICANGRFSEFQAMLLQRALTPASSEMPDTP